MSAGLTGHTGSRACRGVRRRWFYRRPNRREVRLLCRITNAQSGESRNLTGSKVNELGPGLVSGRSHAGLLLGPQRRGASVDLGPGAADLQQYDKVPGRTARMLPEGLAKTDLTDPSANSNKTLLRHADVSAQLGNHNASSGGRTKRVSAQRKSVRAQRDHGFDLRRPTGWQINRKRRHHAKQSQDRRIGDFVIWPDLEEES